ncbi:MAG TPA: chemotaxis protein MotB [Desulfotomaculum sp.]|nr:MAG: chemotaxis protein MotB [Desulfotomaculum sp. BICA1-6]HBX22735.1 chemotaxis protein MotB [Desulfotomaculum sp.]
MQRRRRPKKDSSERWLITYADLITLLMIFFIVMYALSKVDAAKFETLANSLTAAFGAGAMILDSPGPAVVPGNPPEQIRDLVEKNQLEKLKQELEQYIEESGLVAKVSVTTEERGIVLSFQDNVLFELGSDVLTAQAKEILDKIAPMLAHTPNYIRIEGHTDNLPISTARFPSNWELSAGRATNVVRELITTHGMAPEKLSAIAYGEYRPRAPNNNQYNRQLNRRVDLIILRNKFSEAEPQPVDILNQVILESTGSATSPEVEQSTVDS